MVTNTARRVALTFAILPTLATGCMSIGHDDDFSIGTAGDDGDGHDGSGAEAGGHEHGEGDDGCDGRDPSDFEPGDDGSERDPDDGRDPSERDPGVCEPHETELLAGKTTDTGSVSVTNDATNLLISVDAAAPYLLAEVHIYAGTEDIPTNKAGAPAPGQFPYIAAFVEPIPSYELAVTLDELAVGCDDQLNVAVHAVVVSFDEQGNEVFEETAWGFGDETFDGSRWGWSFDYGICCELPPEDGQGCTLTRGYWQTHNSEAEVPALQQPWPIAEDTQLCGIGWLDILDTEPNGDAWLILAHQTIAAQLNVASGASTTTEIDAALASATAYLDACAISDADRSDALAVSEQLDAYNNGDIGPGHCE